MIISLSGLISSGKDTVAEYLVAKHGFKRESFASSLKDAVAGIFSWEREMLEGQTKAARDEREKVDEWWAKRLGNPAFSPRWMLQQFGTEIGRTHIHPEIWIASLENKLRNYTGNVVISDARFFNELNSMKNIGALTVKVSRGIPPEWWDIAKQVTFFNKAEQYMIDSGIHRSEWEWAGYPFDYEIENNATLERLYEYVDHMLEVSRKP
jgi:hypothetical protein